MITDLLQGIVIENTLPLTWTDKLLYTDKNYYNQREDLADAMWISEIHASSDYLTVIPVIGTAVGIIRIAFAALHMLNHSFALIFTLDRRHFAHLAKGLCELSKATIQSIPIIGNIFAYLWIKHLNGKWWMIKIYNPESPNSFDIYANYWKNFRQNRPTAYITT